MNLQQGQHETLIDLVGDESLFEIEIAVSGIYVQINCVGLDENGALSNGAYVIFETQPKSPCNGIVLNTSSNETALFTCQLNNLPLEINRLIFTLSIGGFQLISELNSGYLNFLVAQQVTSTFHFTGQHQHENTITLGELYRKEGVWYFSATMQSFVGELNEIINRKKVILYHEITAPEMTKMFNDIEIMLQKHEQLLIERAGTSGFIMSIGWLDALYKTYAFFMNKSYVFIMNESTLLQRIPSKRNRILVLKIDVSRYIVDKSGKPITLEMKNCVKKMNGLSKLFSDTAISYDDQTNTYQF